MSRSKVIVVSGTLAVLLGICYAVYSLASSPLTVISVTLLCSVAVLILVLVGAWLSKWLSPSWPEHASFAQGFGAIVTVFALFIAAGVYFLERRDKPRIAYSVDATVIRPTSSAGRQESVLLTIRVPVENKSSRRIEIRCMAIDVLVARAGEPLARNPSSPEEMQLTPINERVSSQSRFADACMRGEEALHGLPRGTVRPLYIWPPLFLEPMEIDDRYFEIPVDCESPFVRVIVKMRVNPGERGVYETKTIVPLSDTCRGETESSSGVSRPTVEAGAEGGVAADSGDPSD